MLRPGTTPALVDVLRLAAPLPAPHTPHTPFIGRAAELEILEGAWRSASRRGTVVALEGEPGIGKSALAARFVRELDAPVAWGTCPEHEVAPALWPWEAVLRAVREARPALAVPAEIASLLEHARPADGSDVQDAAGARLRLFDVVARYLAAAAPLVVVLDDLQWADITSTAPARAARRRRATRAPRRRDLPDVGGRRPHPDARRADPARRRYGSALAGLPQDDVRALRARPVGQRTPAPQEARSVTERTAGNPLFVTLLAGAPDGAAAPRLLQDVVLQRLQALPPDTADLLRTAAIAGQEVDVEVLAEVTGVGLDDVIEALDQARAGELLRDDDTPLGTYRFVHALVRDALDSGHSRLRRARWHRRFAEVTERLYADDDDRAGQVARHWLAAAELDPVMRPACRGAHRPGRAVGHAPPRARGRRRLVAGVPGRRAAGRRGPAGTVRRARRAHRGVHRGRRGGRGDRAARRGPDGRGRRTAARHPRSPWLLSGSRPGTRSTTASSPSGCSPSSQAAVRCASRRTSPRRPWPWRAWGRCSARRVAWTSPPETSAAAVRVARALPPEAPGAGPQLLARVLFLRLLALTGFQHAADALATARDLLAVAAAPAPLVAAARIMELSAALTLGRVEEARPLGDRLSEAVAAGPLARPRPAARLRPLGAARTWRAGSRSRRRSSRPTRPVGPLDTNHVLSSWTSQRCDRALQRGTLGDLVDELAAVRRRTGLDGYGAAQALGLAQLGRREEARAVVDGDADRAPRLRVVRRNGLPAAGGRRARRPRAGPFPARGTAALPGLSRRAGELHGVLGAVSGFVGEASLALGELDAAREQLTAAVELLDRAGSPYWSARARAALARCD